MNDLLITVTAQDITDGMPRQPKQCPLALAIARIFGFPVIVGCHSWSSLDYIIGGFLPAAARQFVNRIDRTLPVEPFTFSTKTASLR